LAWIWKSLQGQKFGKGEAASSATARKLARPLTLPLPVNGERSARRLSSPLPAPSRGEAG
jgi:hypothetical protein